jgi:hypothetical protein
MTESRLILLAKSPALFLRIDIHVDETVVGKNIRLNDFGIVKEDVFTTDTNTDFGFV